MDVAGKATRLTMSEDEIFGIIISAKVGRAERAHPILNSAVPIIESPPFDGSTVVVKVVIAH